jgi:methionine-rich copper-binding protein CopC
MQRRARRPFVALLALVAAGVFMVVAAPAASAHDSLVSSSPSDGTTVATVPDRIVLTMNEAPVSVGTEVVVRGPGGDVQQGAAQVVKNTVEQALAEGSPAGRYEVVWRVTSRDGHPVSGTFTFTADAPATPASGSAMPTSSGQQSLTTTSGPGTTNGTAAGQGTSSTSGPTSGVSTGGSGQTGTSWAVWLVVALLALAGVGAATARRRRSQEEGAAGQ